MDNDLAKKLTDVLEEEAVPLPPAPPDNLNSGPSRLEAASVSRLNWYRNALLRFNEEIAMNYAIPFRLVPARRNHNSARNKGDK